MMGDGRDDDMELREILCWYGELLEDNTVYCSGAVCCALSE